MENKEIVSIRRKQLARWFDGKTFPEKEKSFFSQLINGKASFGEKAARRIEKDYGMGFLYLDQDDEPSNVREGTGIRGDPDLALSPHAKRLIDRLSLLDRSQSSPPALYALIENALNLIDPGPSTGYPGLDKLPKK